MSHFVFTLLTFCPPAPPLLANAILTSSADSSAHREAAVSERGRQTEGCIPLVSLGIVAFPGTASYKGHAPPTAARGLSSSSAARAGERESVQADSPPNCKP
eukprot:scaffold1156_cov394-Prasinococcus_capsulatus_cf.AAC.12